MAMSWRRWAARLIAVLLGPPLALLAALVGGVIVLLYSPPGLALTARFASEMVSGRMAGGITIGGISGGIFRHVVLDSVVVRDSTGAVMADLPRVEARYRMRNLLTGEIVLTELDLESPSIHLSRLRRGRWNYEEIFRSGGGPGGGKPPLVELRNVSVRGATVRVDFPSDPLEPRPPISRNGAVPAQPELIETDDGLVRVYRLDDVTTMLPMVRVSTPDNDPITARFTRFTGHLNDPAVSIVDANGELLTKGDSLRFEIARAALPGTVVSGAGVVRWPRGPILYDFTLEADTVDLADLRWVQPDFPAWTGRGRVVARSPSDTRTEFALDRLVLGDGHASATGSLVAIVDQGRGFGVADLALDLRNVSLEVVRPYLDTLPFAGTMSGGIRADGFLDLLAASGRIAFTDALAPGRPVSDLVFDGSMRFGEAGAVFDRFDLRNTRLALGTVGVLIPAVTVPGDLFLVGQVNGAWDNAEFVGTAEHHAPNDAVSRILGRMRFDTRGEVLGLYLDAQLDGLSFDGLRTGYPDLPARGGLIGRVETSGTIDRLTVDIDVTGDIGTISAQGVVGMTDAGMMADSLVINAQRFDAEAALAGGVATAINGTVTVDGVVDSGVPPVGWMLLMLGQSRIGGWTLESLEGEITSGGGMIGVNDLTGLWAGGKLVAEGTLGWRPPVEGKLSIRADAATLAIFDSLARATLPLPVDTIGPRPLEGQAALVAEISGSVEDASIAGTITSPRIGIDRWQVSGLAAELVADSLGVRSLSLTSHADSVRFGGHLVEQVTALLSGKRDSLSFGGGVEYRDAHLGAGGSWLAPTEGNSGRVDLDSLSLDLPRQAWRLADRGTIELGDDAIVLTDTIRLETTDGGGSISLHGAVPGTSVGDLVLQVVALDLADIYGLLAQDTSAVRGLASIDLRLGGTRESPTLRGNATVTGPVFRDARPPLARAVFDYRDQLLRSNIAFWTTGEPVLEVDMSLPYDLALVSREDRKVAGPLEIRAFADSAELALIEAMTPSVAGSRGVMSLDLQVGGSWASPSLEGTFALRDGGLILPDLNVAYSPINAKARFEGNAMVLDTLSVVSDGGTLTGSGTVRFERLDNPVMDLRMQVSEFLAMDVPGVMTVRPTGTVALTGPITRPSIGPSAVRVDRSVIYFGDILAKNVVNLEDPIYAELLDQEMIRRQRLGSAFQNRFLDSLRIENMRVTLGNEVWLRSTDANIQLEGQVVVNKVRRSYQVFGEFNALRGEYTLALGGVVRRSFTVERGTVTYAGTPDLNADLDLQARHVVRAYDGDEVPVVARITGSILVPRVQLSTPGREMPERDIVSYLAFGRSEAQIIGATGQGLLYSQMVQALMGVFSSEVERAAMDGLGMDLFEIRPALAPGATSLGFTRFAAGWQLGNRWFVTLNAGLCLSGSRAGGVTARNFGASIEYRLAREWKLQASAEPVQQCFSNQLSEAFLTTAPRYQLGGDLFWERQY